NKGSVNLIFQNPDGYVDCGSLGSMAIDTDWNDITVKGTVNGDGATRILLNVGDYEGTIEIASMMIYYEKSANTIQLTPEQKAEILEAEMERWVSGMMAATQGYVKAWDVVNEPISGGPWGQRYDLQHAVNDPDAAKKFYWQDYLGDDFVRVPVKFARQYFAENGGNPDDLKLFINDYNLESDWDDNQKLKSLISWIEQWESDGVTRIDGIGSQMHISYYLNPQTQQSKADHIEKMFRLMAATGKLVRITELDMGLVDENGNDIPTAQVTLEQHKLMADYYKWIISKYFEIVPVEQQYGITFWCQTDSPEGSGWRPDQPTGIWNAALNRKPAYAGIAEGLAGQDR
ncbi:MAG: endo-1,4-beta-xylanase, partial [Duncaniella sp.]|nr:endo-1,4-beta-xylanase [Duncaniella sp.]